MEQVNKDEKSRFASAEADSSGREDGTQEDIIESPSPSPPAEDWFAWLQVLAAFCLNLNTW